MSTAARVLICGVTVVLVTGIGTAIQSYAGFVAPYSYLVPGIGGVAGVLVWQWTAPQISKKAAPPASKNPE